MASSPGALKEGRCVGDFKVRRLLHRGPNGSVYSAVHPSLGQKVAIKIVHPHLVSDEQTATAFIKEIERAGAFAHEGIVRALSAGRLDEGLLYVISEFAAGQTLEDLLQSSGRLTFADAEPLLAQLTQILAAAHEHGLIHGDLKPSNVFLASQADGSWPPAVRIADFGISRLLRPHEDLFAESHPAISPYLSPEQCNGEDPDARADIFALGVLGDRLIAAPSAAVTALIDKAIARLPADRHQTMLELRDALARLAATEEPPSIEAPTEAAAPTAAAKAQGSAARIHDPQAARAAPPIDHRAREAMPGPAQSTRTTAKLPRASARRPASGLRWGALWLCLITGGALLAYRLAAGYWPWSKDPHHPTPGMLEIGSTPPGAVVYVDGSPWHRRTPASIPVTRGRHYELYLHKAGFLPWRQQVSLGLQEPARQLRIKLVRAARWGTLLLIADRKADFFLDGRRVGTQTTEVNLAEVRAEIDHEVRITAPGYRTLIQKVRVAAGKVGVFRFPLERVDTPRAPE